MLSDQSMDPTTHPVVVTLTCYGDVFAQHPYRIGKAVMLRHIWACTKGPMPWAHRVRWIRAEELGAWATAANGTWLNHVLWQDLQNPDEGCSVRLRELDRANDAFWHAALGGEQRCE